MRGEFICQHFSNEGDVCGRNSDREEGCKIHWKRRQRVLCKQDGCKRPTASKHGFCSLHVDKYHSKEYYQRKKLNALEKSALGDLSSPNFIFTSTPRASRADNTRTS
ncbi:hypothetical protein RhiirC2_776071 [Rhizophagus irregularis]|uniref:Uncharacterized protein n=1 Tax=Rhizophagus irregularis TaxID=588596 RepID=A0A2N1NHS4_9GLOM|nr:hypothetical protein RhiirC2_776071 [Rhizophagus irregularis]